jgi:hypothetical protein
VKYSEFLILMDSHDNIIRAGGEEDLAYKLACLLNFIDCWIYYRSIS